MRRPTPFVYGALGSRVFVGPRCLACGAREAGAEPGLCRSCAWRSGLAGGPISLPSAGASAPLERAYYLAPYEGRQPSAQPSPLVELLLRFKYQGERRCGYALMNLVARSTASFAPAVDAIVPIPLHRARMARRGYNQAAWLARAIARTSGKRLEARALRRLRDAAPQAARSRASRLRAVDGIFDARAHLSCGRSILLVDDVMTTGATAYDAARALKHAAAARVYLFCLLATTREPRS